MAQAHSPVDEKNGVSFSPAVSTPAQSDTLSVGSSTKQKRSWLGWIWDTADVDPEERHFLFKLDATLLTFGTLGMFIKWIDTSNLTNAFVSGMKEDLNLYGNEYNYIVLTYTVGYVIGQIPSNILLTRVRASRWLPIQELLWTIFTFALAGAKDYKTLMVLRFFVGLFEAGYWASLYYLLGSWYTKREIGKRSGILQASVSIAPIFSGFLQAGIYKGMNGKAGVPGWRWLFIINGVISLPIALSSFFLLPNTPESSKPNWIFTARELDIARARMARAGRAPEGQPYTFKMILGFLSSWKTILFALMFTIQPWPTQPSTSFVFWLKAHNKVGQPLVYTVPQINQYPTIGNAFTAAWMLITVWLSDGPLRGRRYPTAIFGNVIGMIVAILLVKQPLWSPFSERAPLYIISAIGGTSVPLALSYMNELISDNAEQRAFTASLMNTLQYSMMAWIPLVWFQQKHQPDVPAGNKAAAVVSSFSILVWIAIATLAHREKVAKRKAGTLQAPASDSERNGGSEKDSFGDEKLADGEGVIVPELHAHARQ